jgi:hypothetical protein
MQRRPQAEAVSNVVEQQPHCSSSLPDDDVRDVARNQSACSIARSAGRFIANAQQQ